MAENDLTLFRLARLATGLQILLARAAERMIRDMVLRDDRVLRARAI